MNLQVFKTESLFIIMLIVKKRTSVWELGAMLLSPLLLSVLFLNWEAFCLVLGNYGDVAFW